MPTLGAKKFFVKEENKFVKVDDLNIVLHSLNENSLYSLCLNSLDLTNIKNEHEKSILRCKIKKVYCKLNLPMHFCRPDSKNSIEELYIANSNDEFEARFKSDIQFRELIRKLADKIFILNEGKYEKIKFQKAILVNYSSLDSLSNMVSEFGCDQPYDPSLPKAVICKSHPIVIYEKPFSFLTPEERKFVLTKNDFSFISDDLIVFRGWRHWFMGRGEKLDATNPNCVIQNNTLIRYTNGSGSAYVMIPRSIQHVKSDAFQLFWNVLIHYDGTIEQCIATFEKPLNGAYFIVVCDDGTIEFPSEINHKKADSDLLYFFCYHFLDYLTDDAIINHDLYTFLQRRYSVADDYRLEIISYSSDTGCLADSNENTEDENESDEYCILDVDNFFKITCCDYECG